ncbi:MAG: hypothetical protein JWO46_869, partial [Nocardioidaceae bacterium]|nr:hypothetical protein [Nocardioidaceae bacterium]
LTLTSAVDVGSTFTVELPGVERPAALDRALAQGQPDPSR